MASTEQVKEWIVTGCGMEVGAFGYFQDGVEAATPEEAVEEALRISGHEAPDPGFRFFAIPSEQAVEVECVRAFRLIEDAPTSGGPGGE